MKHLVDDREPITMADIDLVIQDARHFAEQPANWLGDDMPISFRAATTHLIARLAAIVENTYGQAHGPEFRPE